MGIHKAFVLLVGLVFLSTWAFAAKPSSEEERIRYLQKQLEAKQSKIEQLKTQNVFLQELNRADVEPNDVQRKNLHISTDKEDKVLTGVDASGPGEKIAYAKVIETYRKEKLQQTIAAKNLLLHHYPKSIYADNSIYFVGILQLQAGHIGEAIKSFNQVVEEYPKGNKRASALFAKSIAYNRLNLPEHARKYFEQILRDYPGSKESQRAWMEMRIMEKNKKG